MANDLQYVLDTLVMPAALPVLRENAIMPALVATDFSPETYEHYQTVRVPLPVDFGTAQDFDVDNGSSSTDLKPKKVDIVLDKWKYQQWAMNDKEMRESVTAGFLPKAAEAAVKSLANAVNNEIWGLYKDIPTFSGVAGTVPSASSDIIAVRQKLQDQLAPIGDRRLVMGTDAEGSILNLYSDVQKSGSMEALVMGSMGHKFGFDTFADQLAPYHTFGTLASDAGPVLVNGAVPADASTLALDGATGTKTIKKGDAFTVANVVDARGKSIQFVFTADASTTTGAATGVAFYPPAPTGGFADNAAITITKPSSGANYAVGMGFHRDAFMFAARALQTEQSENSTISVAVDPVTGIPLRLETWREPGKAKRLWRFDILFGVKTLRPELGVRWHG